MYNANDHHHVVHIGGAEFVPPMMTHFAHVPNLTHSLSPSSESSSSSSSQHTSSPTQSRFSSSSSGSGASAADSLEEWDAVQAHLAYARRMADHTASMWQRERLAIEKAKLDGTYTGNMTSRQNGNARPTETKATPSASAGSSAGSEKKGRKLGGLLASLFSPTESEPASRGRSRRRSHA
ncbi:hypothetical protein EX895_000563 [Sporisorium graminicola]|uniref:Uncharacterized protein n=1 Tax=Sporisorium graminicola TaxID=280036 RepID=A0A4U7L0B1_9BASI|nr:hypothetical protein EX895_000563 [Sporisorium graminicola]TKY90565.1 hypothetical protein EX895_000563 [Sporisorium graminicola]